MSSPPRAVVEDFDEADRPQLPESGGPQDPVGATSAATLVAVHDHLRSEMTAVLDLIGQVEAGSVDPAAARSLVNRMTMRQNYWSVGSFCAAYCRVVTLHHTIEDQRMFRDLRRLDGELAPVLDRLSVEHEVIADVLDDLDRTLVAMVDADAPPPSLRRTAERFSRLLRSHLDYEERQLLGPMSRSTLSL